MKHVGYEERHIEFNPEIHGESTGADAIRYADERVREIEPVVHGLTLDQQEAFREWFADFAKLSAHQLYIVVQRLSGKTGVELAEVTGKSAQNVSKITKAAMRCNPRLKNLLNYEKTFMQVEDLFKEDPSMSAREIARRLNMRDSTVANWLRRIKHRRAHASAAPSDDGGKEDTSLEEGAPCPIVD